MRFTFEIALAVADFDNDFDETANASSEAIEQAADEIQGFVNALPDTFNKKFTIVSALFVEFDSGNPTHANAYFEITAEADQDTINKMIKEHF